MKCVVLKGQPSVMSFSERYSSFQMKNYSSLPDVRNHKHLEANKNQFDFCAHRKNEREKLKR